MIAKKISAGISLFFIFIFWNTFSAEFSGNLQERFKLRHHGLYMFHWHNHTSLQMELYDRT